MTATQDLVEVVESHPLWYHTMELAPGVVTPGWYDLRSIADRLPWPELQGKRCLDVGSNDGFWAFEMERRGAAEVIGIDVSPEAWEWRAGADLEQTHFYEIVTASSPARGFEIAREALGSSVQRRELSVFDLDPGEIGTFDVVFCGSLLLHLKEPISALESMRRVCKGQLLLSEKIDLPLTLLHPRRPLLWLIAVQEPRQWWSPNVAGLKDEVRAAGFSIERSTRPFCLPFGQGFPYSDKRFSERPRRMLGNAIKRVITGGTGTPHAALLARPQG